MVQTVFQNRHLAQLSPCVSNQWDFWNGEICGLYPLCFPFTRTHAYSVFRVCIFQCTQMAMCKWQEVEVAVWKSYGKSSDKLGGVLKNLRAAGKSEHCSLHLCIFSSDTCLSCDTTLGFLANEWWWKGWVWKPQQQLRIWFSKQVWNLRWDFASYCLWLPPCRESCSSTKVQVIIASC